MARIRVNTWRSTADRPWGAGRSRRPFPAVSGGEHVAGKTGHIRPSSGHIELKTGHIWPKTRHIHLKTGHMARIRVDTCRPVVIARGVLAAPAPVPVRPRLSALRPDLPVVIIWYTLDSSLSAPSLEFPVFASSPDSPTWNIPSSPGPPDPAAGPGRGSRTPPPFALGGRPSRPRSSCLRPHRSQIRGHLSPSRRPLEALRSSPFRPKTRPKPSLASPPPLGAGWRETVPPSSPAAWQPQERPRTPVAKLNRLSDTGALPMFLHRIGPPACAGNPGRLITRPRRAARGGQAWQ
jgi:hypothetical protein